MSSLRSTRPPSTALRSSDGDAWRASQARRWLRSVRAARERARAAREMADAQREVLDGIRGIDYASDAVSSGAGDDAVMRAVSAMQAAVRSYAAAEAEATGIVADAFERLSRLDAPLACRILTLHYLRGHTLEQVGGEIGYSTSSVKRLIVAALADAYDVMPYDYRTPRHPAILEDEPL